MTPRPLRTRTSGSPFRRTGRVLPLLLFVVLAHPLHAQDGSADDEVAKAREAAERISRADSVRAQLVQPPADRNGLTAMDVIRAPFELVGGGLALVLTAGAGVYQAFDETGVISFVGNIRSDLSDTGVQVGVDFIGSRSWPALVATVDAFDPFWVEAGYSMRRYELLGAGLDFGDDDRGLRVAARHHVMREPHFWGVGPDSEESDRSDYRLTRTEGGAHGWSDFGGPVRVALGGGWERTDVGRGSDASRPDLHDVFDPEQLFGAVEETSFLRLDAGLDADFTKVERLWTHGVRLMGGYQVFRGTDDTDADFHRATADFRAMLPVGQRHVLALRILGVDHFAESGRGVPFTHLAELGDDDGLRGYGSRRFRDRALLSGQAEVRYEVWWHPGNPDLRVEGFAFGDYGAVGPELGQLDGSDFDFTPGVGLRFTQGGDRLVEVFAAWGGDESPRFDASLGVTF